MSHPRVGVLAVQGGFAEHSAMIKNLKAEPVPVRLSSDIDGLDGLIIPGGESTTISKLLSGSGLFGRLRSMAMSGFPILGTCAGLVMLARLSCGQYPPTFGALDITVERNAYGRQIDSFEADLYLPALGEQPFPGVFIRAPRICDIGPAVTVLGRLPNGNGAVAVRQGKLIGCTFHPELSPDSRMHNYFLGVIAGYN